MFDTTVNHSSSPNETLQSPEKSSVLDKTLKNSSSYGELNENSNIVIPFKLPNLVGTYLYWTKPWIRSWLC